MLKSIKQSYVSEHYFAREKDTVLLNVNNKKGITKQLHHNDFTISGNLTIRNKIKNDYIKNTK